MGDAGDTHPCRDRACRAEPLSYRGVTAGDGHGDSQSSATCADNGVALLATATTLLRNSGRNRFGTMDIVSSEDQDPHSSGVNRTRGSLQAAERRRR